MTLRQSLISAAVFTQLLPSAFAVPAIIGLGSGSTATAVSGDGSTVVGGINGVALRWTRAGGVETLSSLGPATGVSKNGQVIVGASGTAGYRWSQAQGKQTIAAIGTYKVNGISLPPYSSPAAVSGDGATVVGNSSSTISVTQAFKWNGSTSSLGYLGAYSGPSESGTNYTATDSSAMAVSDDGQTIVGWTTSASGYEGFVKVGSATMTGIGDFSGGLYVSHAQGVSAEGEVVVGYGTRLVSGDNRTDAFRWTKTGKTLTLLGSSSAVTAPSSVLSTEARDTSANGEITVGSAYIRNVVTDGIGSSFTVFYNGAMTWVGTSTGKLLRTLLSDAGVSVQSWQFQGAVAISDNADTIVGVGTFNQVSQGFVITGARPLFGLSSLDPVIPQVSVQLVSGAPVVTFTTVGNQSYQVERSTDLTSGWTAVGTPYSTAGQTAAGTHSVTDGTTPVDTKAFYRVTVQPSS